MLLMKPATNSDTDLVGDTAGRACWNHLRRTACYNIDGLASKDDLLCELHLVMPGEYTVVLDDRVLDRRIHG